MYKLTSTGWGSHRVEVLHPGVGKAVCYLLRGDHGSHRVPVAHGFTHGDDVGHHVVQLEAPPLFSQSSETHLDLVGDANSSGLANVVVDVLQVVLGRDDLSSAAQKTLGDEGTDSFAFLVADFGADGRDLVGVELGERLLRVLRVSEFSSVSVGARSLQFCSLLEKE